MNWNDINFCKEMIKKDPENIKYMKQTNELCNMAISSNGLVLEFIGNEFRNDELYKLALNNNGCAIKFINKYYEKSELFELAVSNNGLAIEFLIDYDIKNKFDLYKLALKQNGLALQYNYTNASFILSKKNKCEFTTNEMNELYEIAFNQNSSSIKYIDFNYIRYNDMCRIAVMNNSENIRVIKINDKLTKNILNEIYMIAVKKDGMLLKDMDTNNYDIVLEAVKQNGLAVQFLQNKVISNNLNVSPVVVPLDNPANNLIDDDIIDEITININQYLLEQEDKSIVSDNMKSIYIEAVKQNEDAILFINKPTHDLCNIVIKKNPNYISLCSHNDENRQELEDIAFKHNYENIQYISMDNPRYIEYLNSAFKNECGFIKDTKLVFSKKYFKDEDEYYMLAVVNNGLNLKFIKKQTYEICHTAVKQNPFAINYVKEKLHDLVELAFKKNILSCLFLKDKKLIEMFENKINKEIDNCNGCGKKQLYYVEYSCSVQGTQTQPCGYNNHLICLKCAMKNDINYKCYNDVPLGINLFINTLPEGPSSTLPEGSSPTLPEGSSPTLPEGSSTTLNN